VTAAVTLRRLLALTALGVFVTVFVADVLWERPGLGIPHLFYLGIALLALSAGPYTGAIGGLVATGLYTVATVLTPRVPSQEVITSSALIRAITFVSIGTLVGWYASRHRRLVNELEVLAQRDMLTGLPNTRAFESAITRRLETGRPFALLLGDIDALMQINHEHGRAHANDLLREVADRLASSLAPEDEVARVGGDEFAVLTSTSTSEQASQLAGRLERIVQEEGGAITFGWSSFPQDGENALSLYRAADERLYARKLVRGRRHGTVEPLHAVR
jgi:diguanylate cyclase (GGDEF)-like protein